MSKCSLYKFSVDCGRMGSLEGLCVADSKSVQSIIGKNVHFFDVLGKHSEITVTVDESNLMFVTDDESFIKKAEELDILSIGINPFDYLEDNEETE